MKVQKLEGKEIQKTEKDLLKESLKGKTSLSQKEKDALLMQMAKDQGYLP